MHIWWQVVDFSSCTSSASNHGAWVVPSGPTIRTTMFILQSGRAIFTIFGDGQFQQRRYRQYGYTFVHQLCCAQNKRCGANFDKKLNLWKRTSEPVFVFSRLGGTTSLYVRTATETISASLPSWNFFPAWFFDCVDPRVYSTFIIQYSPEHQNKNYERVPSLRTSHVSHSTKITKTWVATGKNYRSRECVDGTHMYVTGSRFRVRLPLLGCWVKPTASASSSSWRYLLLSVIVQSAVA